MELWSAVMINDNIAEMFASRTETKYYNPVKRKPVKYNTDYTIVHANMRLSQ